MDRREIAYRLYAAEFEDANLEFSDSDEERAPNYVVTPTGARVNRLFVVGVLTEVEPVSDDVLRARIADPTGAFVVYAGQYQPDAVGFLDGAEVPSFVALTGKARTYRPEGSSRVFTSIRPETVTAVDADTRDRWIVQTAEHTLARVATMAAALERPERGESLAEALGEAGVEPGLAAGVALAIDHYGTTTAYLSALREQAIGAVGVVAGERQSAPSLDVEPDAAGTNAGGLTEAPLVYGTLGRDLAAEPSTSPAASADSATGSEASSTAADSSDSGESGRDDDVTAAGTSAGLTDDRGDELGDFDEFGSDDTSPEPAGSAEQFDVDPSERDRVEAEYGTEFSTGSEVGEPGEAGIEPEAEQPMSDDEVPTDANGESIDGEPSDGTAPDIDASARTSDTELDATGDVAPSDDSTEADPDEIDDLEHAVVEAMAALDDGEGADREAVVAAVVDERDVDPTAVEAAIRDALMDGRCYEPADGTLKAI